VSDSIGLRSEIPYLRRYDDCYPKSKCRVLPCPAGSWETQSAAEGSAGSLGERLVWDVFVNVHLPLPEKGAVTRKGLSYLR